MLGAKQPCFIFIDNCERDVHTQQKEMQVSNSAKTVYVHTGALNQSIKRCHIITVILTTQTGRCCYTYFVMNMNITIFMI